MPHSRSSVVWPVTGKELLSGAAGGRRPAEWAHNSTRPETDLPVVENLTQDGVPFMTSVYHLDGPDLRLTHFCAAQNQPRLKATAVDADKGEITFSFVDITNLRSTTSGHVDGLEIRFIAPDHITLRFNFKSGDKDSQELVDLRRKV